MTILLQLRFRLSTGNAESYPQTELSSRPERSVVERSAASFLGSHSDSLRGRKEPQVTRRNQSRRDGTICSPARECRVGFHANRVPKGRHNGEFSCKLFSPCGSSDHVRKVN